MTPPPEAVSGFAGGLALEPERLGFACRIPDPVADPREGVFFTGGLSGPPPVRSQAGLQLAGWIVSCWLYTCPVGPESPALLPGCVTGAARELTRAAFQQEYLVHLARHKRASYLGPISLSCKKDFAEQKQSFHRFFVLANTLCSKKWQGYVCVPFARLGIYVAVGIKAQGEAARHPQKVLKLQWNLCAGCETGRTRKKTLQSWGEHKP